MIASFSDRMRHPRGRRVPCLALGGLPACVCCALLFFPIVAHESAWNIAWLAVMQGLFYLFLTLYCTPYFALVPELGHTPTERLHLSTWISVTFAIGNILASAAPAIGSLLGFDAEVRLRRLRCFRMRPRPNLPDLSPSLPPTTLAPPFLTHAHTRMCQAGLRAGVLVVCAIALVCMYVPVVGIDERRYCSASPSDVPMREALRHCARNRHFLAYVSCDFCFFFSTSIVSTGMPYYLRVLAQIDDTLLPAVIGGLVGASLVWYYPIIQIASRRGKKRLVMVGLLMMCALFSLIGFIGKVRGQE